MTKTGFLLRNKKIWAAGHNGMAGSAVCRRLQSESCELITIPRRELDLRDQSAVNTWMASQDIDVVILAAAKVGGILANRDYPAEFLYDNLMIEANVIEAARQCGVEKLLFLGSSCIYPKNAALPIREDALLSGALEAANQWYALAKISGLKLCESYRRQYGCSFISAMPCNLYGPGDNYDPETSHVIPALLRKFHTAICEKQDLVTIWGSGTPLREFLYVDDLADGLIHMLQYYDAPEPVNIGSGEEISIAELAALIAGITGFDGRIAYDDTKPDGVKRKIMDSSRIRALGWEPTTKLEDGLKKAYAWYLENEFSEHVSNTASRHNTA